MYIRAFHIANDFPPIHTLDDELKYSQLVENLLDTHKDVVSQLAAGFKECQKHIKVRQTTPPHIRGVGGILKEVSNYHND